MYSYFKKYAPHLNMSELNGRHRKCFRCVYAVITTKNTTQKRRKTLKNINQSVGRRPFRGAISLILSWTYIIQQHTDSRLFELDTNNT